MCEMHLRRNFGFEGKNDHKQGNGVANSACGLFLLLCSNGAANHYCRTHSKPDNHNGQHVRDLTSYGDGCSTSRTIKPSDDE